MTKPKPEVRHRVTLEVRGTLGGLLSIVHELPDEVPMSAEVVAISTYAACPEHILALEDDPTVADDEIPDHDPEAWLEITLEWS